MLRYGLSPRVRGNHARQLAWVGSERSIPRVCGGTLSTSAGRTIEEGLSQRVRGNQARGSACKLDKRSIPACAGEPYRCVPGSCRTWVYPRVCGGTFTPMPLSRGYMGLSPRVRGNHGQEAQLAGCQGSIPACAGEPPIEAPPSFAQTVYPRVCGGTEVKVKDSAVEGMGLSPRVRGKPSQPS